MGEMGRDGVPEHDTTVLCSPAGVFPRPHGEIAVDGESVPAIGEGRCGGDPGIDGQAGAGI